MKVIIVEDELLSSRRLERMLNDLQCEVMTCEVSIKSAVNWLKNHRHPDIIFLDIQLSDGMCFEIFDQIDIESAIIFTTAFSDYSLKAFDYKSISYLLKPINKIQLENAIDKTNSYLKNHEDVKALREIIETNDLKRYKNSFTVKIGTKIKIVNVDDILCFYSLDNMTYVYSVDGKYIMGYALSNLIEQLNLTRFFQISRKFILNKSALQSCSVYKNNRLKVSIKMFDEIDIIVSRERVKAFKKWMEV